MFRNGLVFQLIGVVLLIGLLAAGGTMVFKAGVANGISQAPAVATAISEAAENGQAVPLMMYDYDNPYGYRYGSRGYSHHFGFFPFDAICSSIFFLLFFFGFMKMIFFRRMHHGGHMHGPWGKKWEDGVPPMFNEWHKRSHGEKPASHEEETSSESKA